MEPTVNEGATESHDQDYGVLVYVVKFDKEIRRHL